MALDFPDSSIQQTYVAPNGVTYVWNGTSWVVTPILSVSKGGTGFTSYDQGVILYGNSSGTLSKLNPSTSGYVLSTNGTGSDPSWVAMSGGGQTISTGASGQIAFYSGTGSSIKGRSGFTVNDSDGTVNIDMSDTSYAFHIRGGGNVSKFRFDTSGSILHLSAGSGNSAELRLYTGDNTNYTGFKPNATANVTYILPSDKPSTGSSVLQSDTSGNLTWVAMSVSGGAGTVAAGGSGRVSYYPGTGSSIKDATGIDYATSANILTVTAQATTDAVLQLKGFSGSQTGDALVYKKDGSSVTFKVDKDGVISSGTWAGNAVTAYYGGTGQQSYTDGQLLIGNSSTTGLTKSTLSPGIGISIVNGNGSVTINNNRPVVLNLASGFTPVGIGTDYNILRIPEGKNLANSNYNIREVILGVGTTSSGTSTIRLEKSVGPHTGYSGFSLSSAGSSTNVMSADLSVIGGIGETSWIAFAAGYGTVSTGDRIRVNYTAVDISHANFIIQCVLEEY